jgi:hypothetical protein
MYFPVHNASLASSTVVYRAARLRRRGTGFNFGSLPPSVASRRALSPERRRRPSRIATVDRGERTRNGFGFSVGRRASPHRNPNPLTTARTSSKDGFAFGPTTRARRAGVTPSRWAAGSNPIASIIAPSAVRKTLGSGSFIATVNCIAIRFRADLSRARNINASNSRMVFRFIPDLPRVVGAP